MLFEDDCDAYYTLLLDQLYYRESRFRLVAEVKEERLPNLEELELLSAELSRFDKSGSPNFQKESVLIENVLEEYCI